MDDALPHEVLSDCRDLCASLADRLGKPVTLAYVDSRTIDDFHSWAVIKTQGAGLISLGAAERPGPCDSDDFNPRN